MLSILRPKATDSRLYPRGYIAVAAFPRDLYAYVRVMLRMQADLAARLIPTGGGPTRETLDLGARIRVFQTQTANLTSYIKSNINEYYNLNAILKPRYVTSVDLPGFLEPLHWVNLAGWIRGMTGTDLGATIDINRPVDLSAIIRPYYQSNMHAWIYGWAEKNLGAYLVIKGRSSLDLGAYINDIHFVNLRGLLRGWAIGVIKDLHAYLNDIHYTNLSGYIFGRQKGDLRALIYGISSRNLLGWIHGWQIVDLNAAVYPEIDFLKDLIGIITPDGWANIVGIIYGWAVKDLRAYLGVSSNFLDLSAILSGFSLGTFTKDLRAIIAVEGQVFDLGASIIPRLVKFVTMLDINTMEYLDLSAVLNIAPCWNFRLADLPAYLYTIQKKDLVATIYGWKYPDYYRDLSARINMRFTATVERALDEVAIVFLFKDKVAVDDLTLDIWDMEHFVDDFTITYRIGGGFGVSRDLMAYIVGMMHTFDLPAIITGVVETPYIAGGIFGPYADSTLFTAPYILNDTKLWERMVQITFLSGIYDYFYQSASDTLWKVGSDKWIIDVSSWREETDLVQDKSDVRKKYIFDLSEYESLDEAVRHAIDWVIGYPRVDLSATITATSPGIFADLAATIYSMDKSYTDARLLNVNIICDPL